METFVGHTRYWIWDKICLPDGLELTVASEGLTPAPPLVIGVLVDTFILHNPVGPAKIEKEPHWKITDAERNSIIGEIKERISRGRAQKTYSMQDSPWYRPAIRAKNYYFGVVSQPPEGYLSTKDLLALKVGVANRSYAIKNARAMAPWLGEGFMDFVRTLEGSQELSA